MAFVPGHPGPGIKLVPNKYLVIRKVHREATPMLGLRKQDHSARRLGR